MLVAFGCHVFDLPSEMVPQPFLSFMILTPFENTENIPHSGFS